MYVIKIDHVCFMYQIIKKKEKKKTVTVPGYLWTIYKKK